MTTHREFYFAKCIESYTTNDQKNWKLEIECSPFMLKFTDTDEKDTTIR